MSGLFGDGPHRTCTVWNREKKGTFVALGVWNWKAVVRPGALSSILGPLVTPRRSRLLHRMSRPALTTRPVSGPRVELRSRLVVEAVSFSTTCIASRSDVDVYAFFGCRTVLGSRRVRLPCCSCDAGFSTTSLWQVEDLRGVIHETRPASDSDGGLTGSYARVSDRAPLGG